MNVRRDGPARDAEDMPLISPEVIFVAALLRGINHLLLDVRMVN